MTGIIIMSSYSPWFLDIFSKKNYPNPSIIDHVTTSYVSKSRSLDAIRPRKKKSFWRSRFCRWWLKFSRSCIWLQSTVSHSNLVQFSSFFHLKNPKNPPEDVTWLGRNQACRVRLFNPLLSSPTSSKSDRNWARYCCFTLHSKVIKPRTLIYHCICTSCTPCLAISNPSHPCLDFYLVTLSLWLFLAL